MLDLLLVILALSLESLGSVLNIGSLLLESLDLRIDLVLVILFTFDVVREFRDLLLMFVNDFSLLSCKFFDFMILIPLL